MSTKIRFRGLIRDGQQIQNIIRVLQSFSKFSETFLFRLSSNELELLNDLSHTSTAFVVKCLLKCDDYFDDYSFRGFNSDNNLICFRLRSDSLSQVLSSLLPHIKELKFRLTKSSVGSPTDTVLSLSVKYPTNSDSDRYVCHQIKIDIIKSEEWNDICGQESHSFDLSIYLPESRIFSGITERLGDVCRHLEIRAKRVNTTKAFAKFSIETDSLSIKSKFNDLDLNTTEDIDSNINVSEELVTVRIDARKVNLLFTTLKHLKPTSVLSNISDKNKICFQFFHNLFNFRAFLPNIEI